MSADSYAELVEGPFAAFEDRHTLPVIEDVVERCRTERASQAPRGAQFELLECLARQRLTDLSPTRADHG